MKDTLRKLFVSRLIESIGIVSPGSRFERLGTIFLQHYLGIPLNNRGLNVLGNPVGHSIDTVSDIGDIGAEFTTEKKYFEGRMPKAWQDVRHAREAHPDSRHIFLLCTETAPPSRFDQIVRTAGRCFRSHGVQVHLYDSRRIAETIVDYLLASDGAVGELAEYLPPLEYIRDEFEATQLCPNPDAAYVPRPEAEKSISDALDRAPCVVIAGIGGSGKSLTAAAIATARKERYDLIVWHDARDLVRIEQIHELPIARSGNHRNVGTLLRTLRCLLVLDDLHSNFDLQALSGFCRSGSNVLITRRSANAEDYSLPPLERVAAESVLNRDTTETCPQQIFDRVWRTVGGHPLTLRLMNAAVHEGASWSDIGEDCGAVGEFTDANTERVADRVLKRLAPAAARELSLFAWADQAACDRGFARAVLKPVGVRKLSSFCLTTADTGSGLRIHDIIFACLRTELPVSSERARELVDALDEYIREVYDKDLELVSLSLGMRPTLEALVRSGERRATFLYALIQGSSAADLDPGLIGDVSEYVRDLSSADADTQDEIAVAVALEQIEAEYRHHKTVSDVETAKKQLATRIPLFDALMQLPRLTVRSRAEVEHHRSKALNLTGDKERAIAGFETVISGSCPLDAARLQLIRIYGKDPAKADRVQVLASQILERAEQAPNEVATSVVLATVEAIPWTKLFGERAGLSKKFGALIEERVISSALAGSEQPYQTFAVIGRHWAWDEPERFIRIWTSLPRRSPEEMKTDQDRFAYGDILRQAAQGSGLPEEERAKLRSESLSLFESIAKPTPYQIRTKGQLLVDMGRCEEAEEVLLSVADPKQEPWRCYWLSKARNCLGYRSVALNDIDTALSLIDSSNEYWSTFKAQRFEVRVGLTDSMASEDLREAIAFCKNERFKHVLETRLEEYERLGRA